MSHHVYSKEEKLDTGSPPSHPTKHLPERGLRGGPFTRKDVDRKSELPENFQGIM